MFDNRKTTTFATQRSYITRLVLGILKESEAAANAQAKSPI